MPIIEIKKPTCPHCNSGKRTINITSFKRSFVEVNKHIANVIWKEKCCCGCKAKAKEGEVWALSINPPEKNRIWCPTCAEIIQEKLGGC